MEEGGIKMVGQKLGEVRKKVENIFKNKMRQLGVKAGLQLNMVRSIWGPPIVGENVYGEAFPFEKPPRVWLEVFVPDATEKKITKTICHELVHIKYPELKDGDPELERKIQACLRFASL